MTIAGARAPRMRLINVATGKSRKMQFNPTELEEAISVNYARQTVPGLSHEVLQFVNTKNRTFPLNLFFENATFDSGTRGFNPIIEMRKFFRELVYPRRVNGLAGAGAPRVLMVFPGFISITAVVVDLTMTYTRFNVEGQPAAMNVEIELEEAREVIRLSEEVEGVDNE